MRPKPFPSALFQGPISPVGLWGLSQVSSQNPQNELGLPFTSAPWNKQARKRTTNKHSKKNTNQQTTIDKQTTRKNKHTNKKQTNKQTHTKPAKSKPTTKPKQTEKQTNKPRNKHTNTTTKPAQGHLLAQAAPLARKHLPQLRTGPSKRVKRQGGFSCLLWVCFSIWLVC